MTPPSPQQQASDFLWEHWHGGSFVEALPAALRPTTRQQAYAIQARLEARDPTPLAGWKIAATSAAGQAHIGVAGPMAGRLLAQRIKASGATLSLAGNGMSAVEPEFVFRLGTSLPPLADGAPPYTVETVMAAVADLLPGLEVPSSRYRDFVHAGEAQIIADNACAHDFVLGAPVTRPWRSLDLVEHPVTATVSQVSATSSAPRYTRQGKGANVLGDPRVALTWLANELAGLGITLAAGQIVTTGTCMQPLEVIARDKVEADFGVLGCVSVRFDAREE